MPTHVGTEEHFLQLGSSNPSDADRKQEATGLPGNAEETNPAPTEDLGGGKQTGDTEESPPVPEVAKPEKQENSAPPGPEKSCSKPLKSLVGSPVSPPQQSLTEGRRKRLQLYGPTGEKLSNVHLSNPQIWQNISYIRPGWAPVRLPFLHTKWYWILKANSTVVSTSVPQYVKDQRKDMVACGVTCYIHPEGPWCEVQASDGAMICLLAADPQNK